MTSHPIHPLPCPNQQGVLLLAPCPGTGSNTLEQALLDLKNAGAAAVITLMLPEEMRINKVDQLQACCQGLDLKWFNLPIDDESIPTQIFNDLWGQYRDEIHALLDGNLSVVIHCKGGSGRTGLVAAKIMLERGAPKETTLKAIKALRPNAFSHKVQQDFIAKL